MLSYLNNEHLWVYLAFVVFLLIFGKTIFTHINNLMLSSIQSISDVINNSMIPLESSQKQLEKKQKELKSLNGKIQQLKAIDKQQIDLLFEHFYEDLLIKVNLLKNNLHNYQKISLNQTKLDLYNDLINKNCTVITSILSKHLPKDSKDKILLSSIDNISNLKIK